MVWTPESSKEQRSDHRKKWIELLRAGWMFHQQCAKDAEPEIIGADRGEAIFHQAVSVGIMDAMSLIQELEVLGYFEDDDEPLSTPGMAG
jgi:hypothetical protein